MVSTFKPDDTLSAVFEWVSANSMWFLERIPIELRVFDFPHIVFVRFSAEIKPFLRPFSGSPTNPPILNVRFSYSSVDLLSRFSMFAMDIKAKSKLSIQSEFALTAACNMWEVSMRLHKCRND